MSTRRVIARFDTADRAAGSIAEPVFRLEKPIYTISSQVISVTTPMSITNVTAGFNTFLVDVGAGDQTVTIPIGVYTASTLAAAVQTALVAIDATFTAAYNSTTQRVTITRGAGNYELKFATLAAGQTDSAWRELGFAQTDLGPGFASYTGSAAPDLAIPNVYMICRELSAAQWVQADGAAVNTRACCARIPGAGEPSLGRATWTSTLDDEDMDATGRTPDAIHELNIRFLDARRGVPMDYYEDVTFEVSFLVVDKNAVRAGGMRLI